MKNKAFTLVELLAVIIILGVIALITTPRIQKTLKNSKKNIYESSAYALSREADNFYMAKRTDITQFTGCTYNFTDNSNTCTDFSFSGKKPDSGTLEIDKDGKVKFSLKYDKYCYTKRPYSDKISVIENCTEDLNNLIPLIVTSGDGLYESELESGRLIYRGANPNNYIWLDENGDNNKTTNELYRIISYETDGTIKIVRNEKIGEYSWDEIGNRTSEDTYCTNLETSGCNVWGNSTNTQFQGKSLGDNFYYSYYENNTDTMLTSSPSGKITKDSSLNTFLNGKTTTSWQPAIILNKYIENHKFNVGGLYYYSYYKGGDKGLKKERTEESLYTWLGKIGLMNITEYVETSLNQECTSLYSNYYYNTGYYYKETNDSSATIHLPENGWPCKQSNWAMKDYNQWTMTTYSHDKTHVWDIAGEGSFSNNYGNNLSSKQGVNPAFYLKSDISLAGIGTEVNPYYIID